MNVMRDSLKIRALQSLTPYFGSEKLEEDEVHTEVRV